MLELADKLRTEADAYRLMEQLRWGDGEPTCPHCANVGAVFIEPRNGVSRKTRTGAASERRVWRCRACRKQFSVLTGTVFHGARVSLRLLVLVAFEMCASKNGISAREVERKYGVCPRTAWFLLHRVREAMDQASPVGKMVGTIAADETFIGGRNWNRHASKRDNPPPKTPVLTLVNRTTGEARSRVIPNVRGRTLKRALQEDVHISSVLHTDSWSGYRDFGAMVAEHHTVNHAEGEYVRDGKITSNHAENFFSQLKRSLDGTHHHVSREHLHRYLAEFDYRFTTRALNDGDRMARVVRSVGGRRLTYKRITA